MSKLCSCIVPCFNEEEVIPLYYEEMQKVRKQEEGKIDFEIIFIDDGSKDKTLEVIKKLSEQDEWQKHLIILVISGIVLLNVIVLSQKRIHNSVRGDF